ncbi:hypothetical protein D3C75_1011920 [compost metagenome]
MPVFGVKVACGEEDQYCYRQQHAGGDRQLVVGKVDCGFHTGMFGCQVGGAHCRAEIHKRRHTDHRGGGGFTDSKPYQYREEGDQQQHRQTSRAGDRHVQQLG